ncbi:MAG: transcription-repair coupling factor [Armatimonadetes bacterium]|nr:transcription-repair coupling factor [Armatimonadota bacterium]
MRTADWVKQLADHPDYHPHLVGNPLGTWQSLALEARPALLASSYLAAKRKILLVVGSYERALQYQAKFALCGVSGEEMFILPSALTGLFEDSAPEQIALSDRLGALRALISPQPGIVMATVQAALERTLPRDVLEESALELKQGQAIPPERVEKHLTRLGYEQQEPVRLPGQFSRRGGILDIYPTGRETPIRIEYFGDEVESIRVFDPNTQRSIGPLKRLNLSPSRETLFPADGVSLSAMLLDTVEREAAALEPEAAKRLEELVTSDAQALDSGVFFDRLDLYRPLLHPDSPCAIGLLAEDEHLVLDEPLELGTIAARAEEELGQALSARAERGEILSSVANDYMLPPEEMGNHEATLTLTFMNDLPSWTPRGEEWEVDAQSLEPYQGRSDALTKTIKNYISHDFCLVFCTDQPSRAKSVLTHLEIFPDAVVQLEKGNYLAHGNLGGGFVLPGQKIAFLTDAELFGVARLRMPQRRFMEGAPVATVLDLKPGDYVVHIHFGIGVFRGLTKRTIEGVEKEFLFIEYAAPDKLFVPADQLDRIQKYLNPGEDHPKLNRLTGGEWQRTLGKAKEEAREFARDLIKLYAQRKEVKRRAYGPDTPWQAEMESTFPWVETPSQMQAIVEAKRDLELDFPMDRLVCGDVGFGKTEVAIRAAFKACQDNRQVAVLCPTTILSEQHFRNFQERLGPFGVRLALLNRFTSAAEKRETMAKLKAGEIDIVLGTHSLLNQEIGFHDLGMVVVDEEQKFGVKQKELLKQLRSEVDVLTMSATPIPRTLSMALMDIRQMSLINDPPPGRLPIRTYLRPYAGDVVREAILRELARGGQVFYVYNRVDGIHHVAEKLRRLVPTARIGVGHGQMTEKELEPIMIGFIKGEIDILLSTTIIENGIDISNANTLLVENADKLGLAQLYQLRGRVGRSDRQAYAYLLYENRKELSDHANMRLEALQEFSQLGAGYSLAFRDLQIRGAGELLGSRQHGAMTAVGYELYVQLINEAVKMLKNSVDGLTPSKDVTDPLASLTPLPTYDLSAVALLPETYIKDQAQRLYYYQKMMSSRDLGALAEAQGEIEDRYGKLPDPARNAFRVMNLRLRGRDIGVEKIEGKGGSLTVWFRDKATISPRVWSILTKAYRDCYMTKESLIWPHTGDPVTATERFTVEFERAQKQVSAERELLER